MGKATRNRALRKQRELLEREHDAVREWVLEILKLEDLDSFLALLARRAELLSDSTVQQVAELANAPAYGPLFVPVRRLLQAAVGDPCAAWDAFASERQIQDARGKELQAQQEQIDATEAAGEIPRALKMLNRVLPLAIEIGYGLSVCELLHQRGRLLCKLSSKHRAEELEEALESFEAALEVAVSGEQAARILMHRGLAYGERVKGDPAQNIERAIASLRDGLAQIEGSEDRELRAMMQTNLAVALLRRRRDRLDDARAAVRFCREALTYRDPERDADNWAYTQINLAYTLQTVAEMGEGDPGEARSAYQTAIDCGEAITDPALVGGAHHGLGRLELSAANHTPAQMFDAHAEGELDELFENTAALQSAREHLTAALALTPKDADPLRYARILDDLSNALQQLGEVDEALTRAHEGLELVSPESAPVTCKELAWRTGAILAVREDWPAAAAAFKDALSAAEITINVRVDNSALATQTRSTGNLHRWAAYAFAQAGDLQAAAVALDTGRARELQRRLGLSTGDKRMIAHVPSELRIEYETAAAAFVALPIDTTDSEASRRLGEVIAAIRELPGLAHFRTGARWSEIATAVEPAWPLVYVNPAPQGTLLLMLHRRQHGDVSTEARFISPTSTEIFMRMIVNGGRLEGTEPSGSFVLAASGQSDDQDIASGLDQLLPWLSETITAPLVELLESINASAATLVPCGTLDMAPLQATTLPSDDETLADRIVLRYAPSATVCATAISRAKLASETPRRLVALADPDGSLPAAQSEVKEIAAVFDGDTSDCASGSAATLAFLKRHAPRASHLHLACHARGGMFDADEAAIELASGPLPASALTTIAQLKARLVVVSACQSAQATMSGLLQAEFSIAAALLAAGSACVIASLWPVDDLATALLMTRLYQELRGGTRTPPEALRAAQLWLRDVSEERERKFLDHHSELAAEYALRVEQDRTPGRRGGPAGSSAGGSSRPYAHPDYWAAFIAIGA